MTISQTEIAWAAGFYDGEGCMSASRQGHNVNPVISAAQKDLRPLRRLHAIVGVGRIGKHNQNGVSYWKTAAIRDVLYVMDLLWPYLSEPKRAQATRILDQWTHVPHGPVPRAKAR